MQPMQQAAKPQQQGAMPPPIMAPSAPNYQAQTPNVPQIGTPSGLGYQPQSPSVPGLVPGSQPSVQAPGVGAQQASAGRFDVEAFRPFADAVFSEATRQLDPMMQQREADFRQRMVNQGLAEGTEAYDKAFANFSRERNDAYSSARNQSLA